MGSAGRRERPFDQQGGLNCLSARCLLVERSKVVVCIICNWSPIPLIAQALPEKKRPQRTDDFLQYLAYHEDLCIPLPARHSVSLHLRV